MMAVKRGDVWIAELGDGVGSEQQGNRPVIILQNNTGNMYSETTIVACITSKLKKTNMPTHVELSEKFLLTNSEILLEQIRTISKDRLISRVGKVSNGIQDQIDNAILVSLGVNNAK